MSCIVSDDQKEDRFALESELHRVRLGCGNLEFILFLETGTSRDMVLTYEEIDRCTRSDDDSLESSEKTGSRDVSPQTVTMISRPSRTGRTRAELSWKRYEYRPSLLQR